MVRAYLLTALVALPALMGCGAAVDGEGELVEDRPTEWPQEAPQLVPVPDLGEVTHTAASATAGLILLISDGVLFAVSPEGELLVQLDLPAEPCGLAVRGRWAGVSHSGYLTLIDLEKFAIERIYKVPAECSDVVLGKSRAYLLPLIGRRDEVVEVPFSGEEPRATEVHYNDCSLAFHRSGEKIYAACNSRVARIGLDENGWVDEDQRLDIQVFKESACNKMWLTQDGEWAYLACGGRLRTNDVIAERGRPSGEATDLSAAGELPFKGISSLCDVNGAVAVVPAQFSPYRQVSGFGIEAPSLIDEEGGRTIQFFSHPRLEPLKSVSLPNFLEGGPARGHAVFCGLRDNEVQVLARDDETGNWGLVRLPVAPPVEDLQD